MAAKRNLNIPIYDVRTTPAGAVIDDEDIIDAEVIEDGPTIGDRVRSGFTREPSPRTQAERDRRAQQRERAAEAKQSQAERASLARDAKGDQQARLKLETIKAGEAFRDSIARSKVLHSGQTKASRRKQLDDMHQVYASMMVLQCVGPLQQGLSAENLVSVLGMGASMWLLSPDFRTQLGNYADQVGDVVRGKIEARQTKKDDRVRGKIEALNAKGKGGDRIAARWQKRLDRIEAAEPGHRLPMNAESAAMIEVALAESAYADMRKPNADVAMVETNYREALSALYEFVEEDGIPKEDVSRAMRAHVGKRLTKEPGLASVFNELGHGEYVKTAPTEVILESGEKAWAWPLSFEHVGTGKTVESGSFGLRSKLDLDEHRVTMMDSLTAEIARAKTADEMNDVLEQYAVAAAVAQYPAGVEEVTDPATKARFAKARTMFTSMTDDGLTAAEQQFAYTAAYIGAVERAHEESPRLGAEWIAKYGHDWRQKVSEKVAEFSKMGTEAGAEARAAEEQPKRRFWASRSKPEAPREKAPEASQERGEDIVDAEVVGDDFEPSVPDAPSPTAPTARVPRRRLDAPIYDGELLDDERKADFHETISGEVITDAEIEAVPARRALGSAVLDVASKAKAEEADISRSTTAKIKRARQNQIYNETDTGSVLGLGSDHAPSFNDNGIELG